MRRRLSVWAASAFLISSGPAAAQNTLDALQDELNQAKQQHDDVTSKVLNNFFAQIDAGMASPDAALTLYTDPNGVNGPVPDPTPVATENEHETPTEESERKAIDQANLARLALALQLHCGILHFAALFALQPDKPGLHEAWVAWLKTAAPLYIQLAPPIDRTVSSTTPPPAPVHPDDDEDRPHHLQRPPPFIPNDMKNKSVRDSLITRYLGFNACNDKDQGSWAVHDIPRFYRTEILEPLRAKPTQATLDAWDAVIAMANADEPNNDRWNQDVYPSLAFDRACDAYLAAPNTESLERLVQMIQANPNGPHVDDWIARVQGMVNDYRTSHGLAPAASPSPAAPGNNAAAPTTPANPNVTVTTQQQGDMTIITTHTNTPGATPPGH